MKEKLTQMELTPEEVALIASRRATESQDSKIRVAAFFKEAARTAGEFFEWSIVNGRELTEEEFYDPTGFNYISPPGGSPHPEITYGVVVRILKVLAEAISEEFSE